MRLKAVDEVQVIETSKSTGEVLSIYDKPIYGELSIQEKIAKENAYREKKIDDVEMAELISETCGDFYFYFFNRELDKLNIKESMKVRFLFLCTYVGYYDNGGYITHDNNVKVDKAGIKGLLNVSDNEGNLTIKTFIDNGLLIKDGKSYRIDNKYMKKGGLNSKELKESYTRLFNNGIRELYNTCDKKQHKQLFYILKLLPYSHFRCNAICKNPDCKSVEDVEPYSLTEICELIGINATNCSRFKKDMLKLQLKNQYAFVGIICGSGVWYKINPLISYAGTSGCLDDFKGLIKNNDFHVKCKK